MADKVSDEISSPADASKPEQRLGGASEPRALLAADVDRVKNFVFETARLPEMRGASQLLDRINHIELRKMLKQEFGLQNESVIYAAGGSLLVEVPLSRADEIKDRIEKLYLQETGMSSITVVYLPLPVGASDQDTKPDQWLNRAEASAQGEGKRLLDANQTDRFGVLSEDFGSIVRALSYELRRRKASKCMAPVFEVSPYTERCEFCQLRPAVKLWRRNADDPGRPTCNVCENKRREGREEKLIYAKKFEQYLEEKGQNTRYALKFKDRETDVKAANDLESIGGASQSSRIKNYVGILYADGNDVGRVLEGLSSKKQYREFAKELRDTIEDSVMKGLAETINGPCKGTDDEGRKIIYHPFEIISIGGDDIYLFAPPDVILELACRICETVESHFKDDKGITLSAGILITHANSPAYFTRRIVEGLLKSAKKRAKDISPSQTAIDFLVTTTDTTASEDIEGYRKAAYHSVRFPKQVLTERPYTLSEMKGLIEQVRALKNSGFPKSQLYSLRRSVVEHPQPRATNFYYYQIARDEKKQQLSKLHEWLKHRASSNEERLPFYPVNGGKEDHLVTPIVDLLEVYDFIREAQP